MPVAPLERIRCDKRTDIGHQEPTRNESVQFILYAGDRIWGQQTGEFMNREQDTMRGHYLKF